MKEFLYTIFIASVVVLSCSKSAKKDEALSKLKHQKYVIDSAITPQSLQLFLKVKGKDGLVPGENGRQLKNIEAAYNVFKDASGKVVYIAELPFSPKDDWFISYKSYFNKEGKLIAFQRQNNFFGSECTKGAAMENLTKFYSPDFSIVDSVYTLTDTNKNNLDKATCKFPYDFPYKVSKTLEEYKKERGIKDL